MISDILEEEIVNHACARGKRLFNFPVIFDRIFAMKS
jgi:hypothetical protein